MIADLRQIRMRIGPEVSEAHERLAAGVLEGDPFAGPLGGDEDLVLGHLAVPDEVRAVHRQLADRAAPLDDDQAVGTRVLDGRRCVPARPSARRR